MLGHYYSEAETVLSRSDSLILQFCILDVRNTVTSQYELSGQNHHNSRPGHKSTAMLSYQAGIILCFQLHFS